MLEIRLKQKKTFASVVAPSIKMKTISCNLGTEKWIGWVAICQHNSAKNHEWVIINVLLKWKLSRYSKKTTQIYYLDTLG